MSSDYYGAVAGEMADQPEAYEAFSTWLDEYTRHEPASTGYEELRVAFLAGWEAAPQRGLKPCGTTAAYDRHRAHGEVPCGACKAAQARRSATYRAEVRRIKGGMTAIKGDL